MTLRVRGQWFNRPAIALDFSREGVALLWPNSLAKHRTVFVSLQQGALGVENLVGVVHNCTPHERGYRLGVRFRTDSELQLDRSAVIARLHSLYEALRVSPATP